MTKTINRLIPMAIAVLILSCNTPGPRENLGHPNVIIVMTDDQGYGKFSCNGNPVIQTPNIDRLCVEGISFTDFHVSPMCTPTRGELKGGEKEWYLARHH